MAVTVVKIRGFIAAAVAIAAALVFFAVLAAYLNIRLPVLSAISDSLGF